MKTTSKIRATLFASLFGLSLASAGFSSPSRADDNFLAVDDAFKVDAEATQNHDLRVLFVIADGYSLYKDRITIKVTTPGINTGRVAYPPSETHTDEFFGPQQVYTHDMSVEVPLDCKQGTSETILVSVSYQGCADAGLCYPMEQKEFKVELPDGSCAD
jgi:thioredoxin:protein disulfide reductase